MHGGFLVKIAEEAAFQTDVHADDRFMWVSDMGWIMGPWVVVGTGAAGATLVLREGAPDHPGPGRLWEQVERHRITVLGVSPTLIRALRPHGDEPVAGARPLVAADPRRRPASRGTPSRTGGSTTWSARVAARSSTSPAAPRWARAFSRRCR